MCFFGPRATFATGDEFLAGGGAVDLVDLGEVVWTDPPDREEAGSPDVLGAVALHATIDELNRLGWDEIRDHDEPGAVRESAGIATTARTSSASWTLSPASSAARRLP